MAYDNQHANTLNLIITDGGNREGTYGSYLIFDSIGNRLIKQSFYWGVNDHNWAEYLSLLRALEMALTLGLKDVIIFTDSQTVALQLRGERPLYAEKLKPIKEKIEEKLKQFIRWEIQNVSRILIKNHLGH